MIAAIFDWDGVVIDSSAKHEKSWNLLQHAGRAVLSLEEIRPADLEALVA